MRTDAFLGLLALCAIITPAVVWLVLRRWARLDTLPARVWLLLHGLGALLCLAVLPRKHIESAIILRWPREYWAWNLAQLDNDWWEQIGKLVAVLLALWLAGGALRRFLALPRSALALGYWTGLSYGIGEAIILAVLFIYPTWGPLFGVNTFTPYTLGWAFVRERLWAVHLHGVMGGLIGLGLYGWIALGSKRRLAAGFLLAMLFHHLVDGVIITAAFVPALASWINRTIGELLVPAMAAFGFVYLAVAYRLMRGRSTATASTSAPPHELLHRSGEHTT